MGGVKIIGVVLLVLGILGLVFGHFEYTKETHEGQFGPFKFSVTEKEHRRHPELGEHRGHRRRCRAPRRQPQVAVGARLASP